MLKALSWIKLVLGKAHFTLTTGCVDAVIEPRVGILAAAGTIYKQTDAASSVTVSV